MLLCNAPWHTYTKPAPMVGVRVHRYTVAPCL